MIRIRIEIGQNIELWLQAKQETQMYKRYKKYRSRTPIKAGINVPQNVYMRTDHGLPDDRSCI